MRRAVRTHRAVVLLACADKKMVPRAGDTRNPELAGPSELSWLSVG